MTALLALAVATAAAAQSPTPGSQHMTAPSLPSQPNKDVVGQPGGTLKTTRDGLVVQGQGRASSCPPPRVIRPKQDTASSTKQPPSALDTQLEPPPGPTGATVVDASFVSRCGTLVRYEKGASVTILEKSGRERVILLARNASIYEGIKAGDEVVVRVPFGESADGKMADRVEKKQKPASSLPASKFSQAQAKVN